PRRAATRSASTLRSRKRKSHGSPQWRRVALEMILARAEAGRPEARVLEHQEKLDDEQRRVEHDEPEQTEPHVTRGDRRHAEMRGKDLADRPWLAAVLSDDPPQLARDPREREG